MTNNTRILLIDNYDSFTYNLQHLIQIHTDVELTVRRNDEDYLREIQHGEYAGVVIGPGPGSPEEAHYFGHNKQVILDYGTQGLPVLGICLGFQGIYQCFGGTLKVADLPMHGKVSRLQIIDPGCLLQGVSPQAKVMRYHSIIADLTASIPDCFRLTAFTELSQSQSLNGSELMAIEHRDYPIYGLQYHPESFATEHGDLMIKNFIDECQAMAYA
jgi:anthranilate synthase component 2